VPYDVCAVCNKATARARPYERPSSVTQRSGVRDLLQREPSLKIEYKLYFLFFEFSFWKTFYHQYFFNLLIINILHFKTGNFINFVEKKVCKKFAFIKIKRNIAYSKTANF
jgi:hypothetical protein